MFFLGAESPEKCIRSVFCRENNTKIKSHAQSSNWIIFTKDRRKTLEKVIEFEPPEFQLKFDLSCILSSPPKGKAQQIQDQSRLLKHPWTALVSKEAMYKSPNAKGSGHNRSSLNDLNASRMSLTVVCFFLVGGFNPSEKYARQIGSFPQGSG